MNDQSLRLGKAKQLYTPEDNSLFLKRKRRAASGGTRTRDVLHTCRSTRDSAVFPEHLLSAFRIKPQSTVEDLGDSVEIKFYTQKVIKIIL